MFNILKQRPPSSPARSKAPINDEDDALTGEGLTKEAIKAHVPGSLRKAKVRTAPIHLAPQREGPTPISKQPHTGATSELNPFPLLCCSIHLTFTRETNRGGVLLTPRLDSHRSRTGLFQPLNSGQVGGLSTRYSSLRSYLPPDGGRTGFHCCSVRCA